MLTARERLAQRKSRPALVQLHRALSRLKSTVTVMNTGAHPDDEQNGLLALLAFNMGMRTVVACSTRGEGGQNTLGPERTGALGVVRSREMEESAREMGADVAWLGHGPDDAVHDFGFSKSGKDTLARWGRDRTIERLVRAYRQFRPDIVIPTFLDVPGQHGHHRAMTEAAEAALSLAADPAAFPEHFSEGLTPWTVAKYYLPAWSGGGDTYDDEVPPPPTTLVITAPGTDPVTGASYAMIGEYSRAYHASQNMGHWHTEPQTAWPLHLKLGNPNETRFTDNLPATLGALADIANPKAADALRQAESAIAEAIAAFPDGARIATALAPAKTALTSTQASLSATEAEQFGHRITRKLAEIDAALFAAIGLDAQVWMDPSDLVPGGRATLNVWLGSGAAKVTPVLAPYLAAGNAERDGAMVRIPMSVAPNAPLANAYLPDYNNLGGNGAVQVELTAEIAGQMAHIRVDPEEPVQIVPAHSVTLSPDARILALPADGAQVVTVKSDAPQSTIAFGASDNLDIVRAASGFTVTPRSTLGTGRVTLPVTIAGAAAHNVTPIEFAHIGRTHFVKPQALDVLAFDLVLPKTRVGYIGGGSDRVGLWLQRMGVAVTELDEAALGGDLTGFDTIVVGIFAFGTRPDLARATERLHRWVNAGGHLVTLYHRPTDGWTPETTPLRPLVIGSPSLRWRVTNPAAEVRILEPAHPLVTGPNTITTADFEQWDKERGLYFASQWDDAYVPLLSMHDDGEQPLKGSLLSAKINKGRHTHTSLVLHHQLDKLVPGAFRILANLLQSA